MSQYQFRDPDGLDFSNGCRSKVPHTSRRLALGLLRVMVKKHAVNPATLNVYKCRACHRWHIGNSNRVKVAA